ncbi:carbohydrate ABC transporter substrate-binding protein [Micrococcales bacterium 31B]|nr:carbohydrate ABC transporter substrate-binding protein [Micrococcales bacterium 31B]
MAPRTHTPRTFTRRTLLTAALAMGAAAPLAACGKNSPGASGDGLRFAWWGADARANITQKVIAAYGEGHPTTQIRGEPTDWSAYWDKLATNVAGNNAPDIIQMDGIYLREYCDRGALLDLASVPGLDTGAINPTLLETGRVDGTLYAVPVGSASPTMALNPTLLNQAGLKTPSDTTWSWDDFIELGAEVTRASGGAVHGVAPGFDTNSLIIWARQHGQDLYNADGRIALTADVLASFWDLLLKLISAGAAPPAATIMENAAMTLNQNPLSTAKSAFAPVYDTNLTAYQQALGSDLTLLRMPGESQAEQPGTYYKASMFWVVSARTHDPAGAVAFVNYLANDTGAGSLMLTERGIPVNSEVLAAIEGKLQPADRKAVAFNQSVADLAKTASPLGAAGSSALTELLSRYGSDVMFGTRQPTQAAPALLAELTQALNR